MLKDYYIFISNLPGLILGMFYVLSSIALLSVTEGIYSWKYCILERIMIFGILYFGVISFIVGISMDSSQLDLAKSIVAISSNCCTIVYYASPCSTMYEVIQSKNSSSLHRPTLLANMCNSCLWLFYGLFALNDCYVYLPNGIGAILCCLQLSLTIVYKKSTPKN